MNTLKAHRNALPPLVQKHKGRIVGTAGDGLLLEFPSVVEAVVCTMEIQAVMAERNAGIADEKKMLFRIGVNLGDVLVEGDDIYGDGVNVAARIEGLAKPGGITISGNVQEQIRDKLDFTFAYDESQKLLDTSLIIGLRRHE
ncbi:MAG: adenylate/guanylate cyclase domain-containing protein [Alphaproteobacteria bacterium]|nr:adenylate/guanylate cyclase domain-containing protein [Alphaproteobacteria bacterium]